MKFSDVPQFTRAANYGVDVPWDYLEEHVARFTKEYGLQMVPNFQRGHVWTEAQQIAFVEFKLRGGKSGSDLQFNHPGWMGSFEGDFVLVDGLQRLTAALRFLRGEIPAFGHKIGEWEGKVPFGVSFRFCVNDLKTRAAVLKWYLEMNTGGTPHTDDEIARVRSLLDAEKE